MVDYLTGLLMLLGSIFCLVASVGIVRLPDALTRMHAATKTGTLGTGLLINFNVRKLIDGVQRFKI